MQENTILVKENLSSVVAKFVIYKPLVAKAARAGQFVILRGREGANACRLRSWIGIKNREPLP